MRITAPHYSTLGEALRIALVVGFATWVAYKGIRLYAAAIVVVDQWAQRATGM